jgi:hypothetical protein
MESETEPMKQRKSGRPLKTDEPLKTYSFSLSESQIALLDGWAKAKGESRSAVLRSLVMRLEVAPVVEAKPMRLVEATAPVEATQAAQDIAIATVAVDAIAEVMNAPAATPEIVTPAEPTVAERIAAALASLDR